MRIEPWVTVVVVAALAMACESKSLESEPLSEPSQGGAWVPKAREDIEQAALALREAKADELRMARGLAGRVGLSEQETSQFVTLQQEHDSARRAFADVLARYPNVAKPAELRELAVRHLGEQAAAALDQRTHQRAVHAIMGNARYVRYRDLIDRMDSWEKDLVTGTAVTNSGAVNTAGGEQ